MFGCLLMIAHVTDAELVAAMQRGDTRSFTTLVTRYQDKIYGLCLRQLGEPQLAQDVAQDVFLAAYRALPNFRGEARFSTWLYRIAVNHCKNRRLHGRRRHRDAHEPLEGNYADEDGQGRQLPSPEPGADAAQHQLEAAKHVHTALASLDDEQRQIVLLRDVDDMDYEQIAEILDVPRGTVKSRLHRARTELARQLQRYLGADDVW